MKYRPRQAMQRFKRELDVYRLVLKDSRTPRSARWLLGAAVAYAVSPIDLVPDFIPVIGHLDDIIVVPLLVWLAIRLIPDGIVEDCRRQIAEGIGAPSNVDEGARKCADAGGC